MGDKKSANNGVKVLNKKDFIKKEAGINNDFFSELFNKPVKDFEVKEEKRGPRFRSMQYSFDIEFKDHEKRSIWAKDYFRWDEDTRISSEHSNRELNENEIAFLKLLKLQKGFVPTFYAEREFEEGNNMHKIIFVEKFQSDLEAILLDDAKFKQNDVLKAIDIYLVNNFLITNYFKAATTMGKEKVYEYGYESLKNNLKSFMGTLLDYVFKDNKDAERNWSSNNNITLINDALYEYKDESSGDSSIAHILANNPDNGLITLTDFFPAHVLTNRISYPNDYNHLDILKIRDGKLQEENQYTGMAITDLDKIGHAPIALGIAAYINHLSLVKKTSTTKEERKKFVDMCIEHTTAQYLRLKRNSDISPYDEELMEYRARFNKVCNAACIYAILRNIHFINKLSQHEYDEFVKTSPLHKKPDFIIANIENLLTIENPNYYILNLKKGMEDIRGYLISLQVT